MNKNFSATLEQYFGSDCHKLRVYTDWGANSHRSYFVLKEIGGFMGLCAYQHLLRKVPESEVEKRRIKDFGGHRQKMVLISEAAVFGLLRERRDEASVRFKGYLEICVLPVIGREVAALRARQPEPVKAEGLTEDALGVLTGALFLQTVKNVELEQRLEAVEGRLARKEAA